MRTTQLALETALRALTALSGGRAADQKDLVTLAKLAGPKPDSMDWDEFLCCIIQSAIRKKRRLLVQNNDRTIYSSDPEHF